MAKLKKILISVTAIICAILISTTVGCFALNKPKYRREFEETHGKLLEDAELLYRLHKQHQDGEDEYHVWQFETEPVSYLTEKGFYDNEFAKSSGAEREQYIQLFKERLYEKVFPLGKTYFNDVPVEYQPNWNSNFMFAGILTGKNGFKFGASYFYDVDNKKLIVWCMHSRHYE